MADNHFLMAYVEQAAIYVIIHQVQRSFSFLLSFLSPDFIPETEPSIRPRGRPLIEPALSNDVQDLRNLKDIPFPHNAAVLCQIAPFFLILFIVV